LKVLGFVIIIVGLVMVYVGITGSQHNLAATLSGKTSPVSSGQAINPSGSSGSSSSTSTTNNSPPGTVQAL